MRLFLTSYQKSGTHQIMPALRIGPDVVDRSHNSLHTAPEKYRLGRNINQEGVAETCEKLRTFKNSIFGHVTYLPEYAEAVQIEPTKVIFNVRDPRDVVVSEFHSIHRIMKSKRGGMGWPNFLNQENGKYLIEQDDPIRELIELGATRWPTWLGWLEHDFVMMVKYEELRLNGVETLWKIHDWLLPYEINMNVCVRHLAPNKDNPTFRRGVPGEWKETFSDEHKRLAEKLLGDVITRLGYEL